MITQGLRSNQQGATLIAGMILLVVIMLTVTTAFTLNSTNVKSVGNMQFRNQAIAAANAALEQVIGSPFASAPTAEEINVDINNDGTNDYTVQITKPKCIRASIVPASTQRKSSISLSGLSSGMSYYNTMWEIKADVSDPASGTKVSVHQGVRVLLNQIQLDAVCP